MQVKNWFQNRRMKWKRQSTSHESHVTESKPATSSQAPHGMSVPSTVVENMEKLAHQGNAAKLCPAPSYPTNFPYRAPPGVVAQLQPSPMKLVSNTGLPAAAHPYMAYPHGFTYPYVLQHAAGGNGSDGRSVLQAEKESKEKVDKVDGENAKS